MTKIFKGIGLAMLALGILVLVSVAGGLGRQSAHWLMASQDAPRLVASAEEEPMAVEDAARPLTAAEVRSMADDQLRSDPVLGALAAKEPEIRSQWVQGMQEIALHRGSKSIEELEDEAAQLGARIMQQYFPKYLGVTSDDAALSHLRTFIWGLEEAAQHDRCWDAIHDPASTRSFLSPEWFRASGELAPKVIKGALDNPGAPLDEAGASRIEKELFAMLEAQHGGERVDWLLAQLASMEKKPGTQEKERELCDALLMFYRGVLAMPPQDAAAYYRKMARNK